MHLNWDAISHFNPNSPDPFAAHGIPASQLRELWWCKLFCWRDRGHITRHVCVSLLRD
jgi:hypothetical protein